jgi:hypothetical protein
MMHYYNLEIGKDLLSVDEILSKYLWSEMVMPEPTELNSEYSIVTLLN